jgi:hypothetical protein
MSTAIVIPACPEPLVREAWRLIWHRELARGGSLTKVPYRADQPSSHVPNDLTRRRAGRDLDFDKGDVNHRDRSSRGGGLPWR